MDELLDVKMVELIRDHIMVHANQVPKEFLLQIVSLLNRGSIHSPTMTSPIGMNQKAIASFQFMFSFRYRSQSKTSRRVCSCLFPNVVAVFILWTERKSRPVHTE